jgi:hypothetical protein
MSFVLMAPTGKGQLQFAASVRREGVALSPTAATALQFESAAKAYEFAEKHEALAEFRVVRAPQ